MDSAPLRQLPLLDERAGDWQVRRSLRARRLAVRVFRDGGVEIVAPQRASATQIEAFVTRHRDWIDRQQARHASAVAPFPPEALDLLALGERWRCEAGAVPEGARRHGFIQALPCQVQVEAAGQRKPGGVLRLPAQVGEARQRELLLDWLVRRATETLPGPLMVLAEGLGLPLQRVQVRRQRTRWGSCSTRGTITLNVCLLFQPPEVVRYLYLHELTHMRHMNHSSRFWAAVARLEPAWRELDGELARGWQRVPAWLLSQLRA
jgi:predicted metal-dependent hydrolase